MRIQNTKHIVARWFARQVKKTKAYRQMEDNLKSDIRYKDSKIERLDNELKVFRPKVDYITDRIANIRVDDMNMQYNMRVCVDLNKWILDEIFTHGFQDDKMIDYLSYLIVGHIVQAIKSGNYYR